MAGLFLNVKNYCGNYLLQRELSKKTRYKKPISFSKVKHIGIIYMVPEEEKMYHITDFVRYLQEQNKTVKALGFTNTDYVPHYCFPKLTYDYYTKKEVNWIGKPSSKFVDDFIKNDFDLMIDLTTRFYLPIHYIAYLASAGFKVGTLNNNNLKHYDFMLNISEDLVLPEHISQLKHYLTNIQIIYEEKA